VYAAIIAGLIHVPSWPDRGAAAHAAITAEKSRSIEKLQPSFRAVFSSVRPGVNSSKTKTARRRGHAQGIGSSGHPGQGKIPRAYAARKFITVNASSPVTVTTSRPRARSARAGNFKFDIIVNALRFARSRSLALELARHERVQRCSRCFAAKQN
jgi:hypothetical protein